MSQVQPPYLAMPDWLLRLDSIPASAKLLWAYLRRLQGPTFTRLPSHADMSAACAISRQCTYSSLRALENHDPPLLRKTPGAWPGAANMRFFWTTELGSKKDTVTCAKPNPAVPIEGKSAPEPNAQSCAKATQQLTTTDNNKGIDKQTTDSAHPHGAPQPIKEEQHIVGTIFPHGCTEPQRQVLLQAIVQARRMGAPYGFIRIAALRFPEMAPWKSIEREMALVAEDAMQAAHEFDMPLYTVASYRNFLKRAVKDERVRLWVRGSLERCKRANAILADPESYSDKTPR